MTDTSEAVALGLVAKTDDEELARHLESLATTDATFDVEATHDAATTTLTVKVRFNATDLRNRVRAAAILAKALAARATALRVEEKPVAFDERAIARSLSPRNLILCSDGTGNAGGRTRGTNVWRLFNYVDWHDGEVEQRAFYNDGVGTDSWRPLKILGGAFGWGLSGNIRELYSFAAQNYRPGDRLFFFGFSRGAFTVRSAVGLINTCGLLSRESCLAHPELVRELLRIYRFASTKKRDERLKAFRKQHPTRTPTVTCIGVWDTVDAIGMPVDELKPFFGGLYRLLFRRGMYDFDDSVLRGVEYGFQALALDDERKTFHPNIWNDPEIRNGGPKIEQVWFAGAHSDVGGSYAKDSLSYASLDWMLGKVAKLGLKFESKAGCEVQAAADVHGKFHDSRAGTGVFYRYAPRDPEQKRRSSAWWTRVGEVLLRGVDTLLSRSERPLRPGVDYTETSGDGGMVERSLVHISVYQRIERATAGYAPLFVPDKAKVAYSEPSAGSAVAPDPWSQAKCTEPLATGLPSAVRDELRPLVRARARLYWAFVGYALLLAFVAGLAIAYPAGAARVSTWSIRTDGYIRDGLEAALPAFLEPVVTLAARYTPWALLALFGLAALRFTSTAMRDRIADRSRQGWSEALGMPMLAGGRSQAVTWIGRLGEALRAARRFVASVGHWIVLFLPAPLTRSVTLLAVAVVLVDFVPGLYDKPTMVGRRVSPMDAVPECEGACVEGALGPGQSTLVVIRADRPINRSGIELVAGSSYEVSHVGHTSWKDASLHPHPAGFEFGRNVFGMRRFGWMEFLRPVPSGHWFELVGRIDGSPSYHRLLNADNPGDPRRFQAETRGELLLFVNDVPYDNNEGVMTLRLARVD